MNKLKSFFKSKTMVVAFLISVVGVLEQNEQMLSSLISPKYFGIFTTGVGVTMAVLRWYTTLPLEDK